MNQNVMTIAGRIDELGAICDSVETRVQGARHAHRAGFAGRIESVATERVPAELAARQANRVDLAVHSLKDLPTELAPEFEIAAITARATPSDALKTSSCARFSAERRGRLWHR